MNSKITMRTLNGLAVARGFAAGPVFVYRGEGALPIPEYLIEPGRTGDEVLRLRRALQETRRDLENMISSLRAHSKGEDVRIFECHLMLLEDPELYAEATRYIRDEFVNAELAIRRTARRARAQFERMNDPYFRERVRDFDDVERRLLKTILGFSETPAFNLKVPSIIVADDLTPSDTVQFPREMVLGFATNGGSTTSHVALLARAMGIPSVAGLGEVTTLVHPGDTLLLDGTAGVVTINPDARTFMMFSDLVERQKEMAEVAADVDRVGVLKDGGTIGMYANYHPSAPDDELQTYHAQGIGLYRTEYLWFNTGREPTEEEQFEAYAKAVRCVAKLGGNYAVTIRTLDIGGDKVVKGLTTKEPNPFLGNRSIRYQLGHPACLRTQLRAILRASALGRVRLMFPMIATFEELHAAKAALNEVRAQLQSEKVPFDPDIPVGMMVEVPSTALNAAAFAREVDFFSIGTNDLVQYVLAVDRGNEAVSYLYQPTNPAVLFLMRRTMAAARAQGIPVCVCGESAADPVIGPLWVAFGADSLSMSGVYIPEASKVLSHLTRADLDALAAEVATLDGSETAESVYARCASWLKGRVPGLDVLLP